jgi:DNA-binding transcriptional ArsR family regulator
MNGTCRSFGRSSPFATIHPVLDYDLDDFFTADTPERVRALVDPVRTQILDLVLDRAATTTELARALDRPKSSVAHHVDVLVIQGFLKVVRTRRVRAIEERFFGRTARRYILDNRGLADGVQRPSLLTEAMADTSAADPAEVMATLRYARIPASTAQDFFGRVAALADEFSALERDGDVMYGFVAATFPTQRPTLPTSARQSRERAGPAVFG